MESYLGWIVQYCSCLQKACDIILSAFSSGKMLLLSYRYAWKTSVWGFICKRTAPNIHNHCRSHAQCLTLLNDRPHRQALRANYCVYLLLAGTGLMTPPVWDVDEQFDSTFYSLPFFSIHSHHCWCYACLLTEQKHSGPHWIRFETVSVYLPLW